MRAIVPGLFALGCLLIAAPADARKSGPPRTVIDTVVIHSTGGPTCDPRTRRIEWIKGGALDTNMRVIEAHPTLGIHYMIGRDGALRKSIPENQIGHHVVGHSERSIAIELVNDGDGRDPFPPEQLGVLVKLLRDITTRHQIPRERVVRHSDLDQSVLWCNRQMRRKVDPGPAFPYDKVLYAVYYR